MAAGDVEVVGAANAPEQETRSPRALRFASALILLLTFTLLLCLLATAQPWFFYHIPYPVLQSFGYSHRAYGLGCDVLLSGDSTGLADLVPAVIEQKTGLKSCNVGEVRSVEDFVGTHYTIDDYLSHNHPPRFLVTGWTPSDLDLEHPALLGDFPETFLYAMQYRGIGWTLKAMLLRPHAGTSFLIWAGRSLVEDTYRRLNGAYRGQALQDERARRDAARGMYFVAAPPQVACEPETLKFQHSTHEKNVASVAEFRRHYTTPQTQVMVYVTPVANCDAHIDDYLAVSKGLGERPLQLLPVSDFNQTNIHLTPQMAEIYSAQIAEDILARMKSPIAPKTDGSAR